MKKYLFVKKIRYIPSKNSPLFVYESDIKRIVKLFIEIPTFVNINSGQNKIKTSHSLCLESFVRLIWIFKFAQNIKKVQKSYDDGNLWRTTSTELLLSYFSSFQDHILIFAYYFYKSNFPFISSEREVSFSSLFGKKNKKKISYNDEIKKIKSLICEKEFRNIVDSRDLLNHRAILFYANTFDKKTPEGRSEAKIHDTDFQFNDFEIDQIENNFLKIFPKLIELMEVVGLEFSKWALKIVEVSDEKL